MDVEEFRKNGKNMIDWICDYYKNIENYPVKSQVEPGYLRSYIPDIPPEEGEKWEEIVKDVDQFIMKGMTHWQSPNFFGYFPINSSYPGILGEMMSATFNIMGFSWICSPACTELETVVTDWMAYLQMLPDFYKSSGTGGGVIQGSGSEAILVAILSSRKHAEMKAQKDLAVGHKQEELTPEETSNLHSKLVAYVSEHTHSSAQKGCMIAGIQQFRIIPTNEHFEMKTSQLEEQIKEDIRKDYIPFFVCATIGTTSAASCDDIDMIGDICNKYDIWMHVDAAYAGSFMILPELREKYMKGIEKSWSYNFNPYKMLLTNFDFTLLYVRDRKPLINALSITPEYLRSKEYEKKLVFDYRDWQVPLGRRFRALKLWFVIRSYGVSGLRKHVLKLLDLAVVFRKLVEEDKRFEVVGESKFSLVCFRLKGSDELNMELLERINGSGKMFMIHTKLSNMYVLRFVVGARLTELGHVENAWKVIQDLAGKLLSEV